LALIGEALGDNAPVAALAEEAMRDEQRGLGVGDAMGDSV